MVTVHSARRSSDEGEDASNSGSSLLLKGVLVCVVGL
jgi:hypothetical protein